MTMIRRQPRFADPAIFARLLTAQAGLTVSGASLSLTSSSVVINLASAGFGLAVFNLGSEGDANTETAMLRYNGNVAELISTKAGTGTVRQLRLSSSAGVVIPDALTLGTDPGGAQQLRIGGALRINSATLLSTATALTNGAGASAGTLGNAPAAGDPTKWIPVDDNGTTRYLPAW